MKFKQTKTEFIPVNTPHLGGNEKKYLEECIDSGWISSEGPFVEQFEKGIASKVNKKFAIAVTNGTTAIDIAVEALGIGPGDEVILPTFTIISCILQIVRSGATPVLVDADPYDWNMDTKTIEEKITSRTKAIMLVHIYGLPVDINPVLQLCQKYNLKMIEDAAEVIGQTYDGKPCGSFGDISTLSFYPNKHITTGEGGMILTDNGKLADTCRSLRNLCFKPDKRFVHSQLGWNARMTNLQAAVGVAQLEQLDKFIERKREIGKRYNNFFQGFKGFQLPLERTDYSENIYWVYGVVADEKYGDAENIIRKLSKKGIGARPFFFPMHKQPILNELGLFKNKNFNVSERLHKQGFYLPSGLGLSDREQEIVAETVMEMFS